jgi:phage/conjugal plasmid C-4 type zinc finger TraR family protein
MAVGWARDGAVQDQIDATVESEVARARSSMPRGDSFTRCEECGAEIPEARRKAVPGVRRCVPCQRELDEEQRLERSQYNRRGNKDSQLK